MKNRRKYYQGTKSKAYQLRITLALLSLFALISIIALHRWVITSTENQIFSIYTAENSNSYRLNKRLRKALPTAQCAIVLGARVYSNGKVSPILRDRLTTALALYHGKKVAAIIVSGDHGTHAYDETNAMRRWLETKGVPSKRIFMDHAGFTTYDTVYRAKAIFKVTRAIFVTQRYHLPRTLFIAKQRNIDAYGVAADQRTYQHMRYYRFREFIAQIKDLFKSALFRPHPRFLGKAIPLTTSTRL